MYNKHERIKMFKKSISSLLTICAVWCTSCSEKPQISIALNGFSNDTIIIGHVSLTEYPDIKNDRDVRIKWDTVSVQNAVFTLQPEDTPSLYTIVPFQSLSEPFRTIVNPYDRVSIHMDFSNNTVIYTTKGSPIADAVNDYNQMISRVSTQIHQARKKDDTSQQLLDSLYSVRMEQTSVWVKKHIDNPAIALFFNRMSPDTIVSYYNHLSPELLNSEAGSLLKSAYRRADKFIRIRNAKDFIKEGAAAPNFTLQDNEGRHFTFSSLRGKWVVLDFWGSWCGWCIKGIPDMKKIHAQLTDKCEFVSIACNDKREDWTLALEKYDMPWTQLFVPADYSEDLNPAILYAVQGYPTKIIVNPDGIISRIYIGESPDFYNELRKLLK